MTKNAITPDIAIKNLKLTLLIKFHLIIKKINKYITSSSAGRNKFKAPLSPNIGSNAGTINANKIADKGAW